MRAPGLSRATRRIVCRAPWSAVAVTEHVLTMTRSASSVRDGTAPDASRSASNPSESAWFTRQPNVITEYFISVSVRRLQGPAADVVTHLHPVEPDHLRADVCADDRLREVDAAADHRQHAA